MTPDSSNNNLQDKSILVVEDNVANYSLILRMLSEIGIVQCEWISSGWKVAQEAAERGPVDLILLDIMLPYEDGFEVHKKLRAHPTFKDARIVAVTANASEQYMQRAIKDGFSGFIGKPLDPDRFPEQIKRLLAGQAVWEWR
jgi:two-component system cell cycle response regulator DivK